jgi:hypothetical protein
MLLRETQKSALLRALFEGLSDTYSVEDFTDESLGAQDTRRSGSRDLDYIRALAGMNALLTHVLPAFLPSRIIKGELLRLPQVKDTKTAKEVALALKNYQRRFASAKGLDNMKAAKALQSAYDVAKLIYIASLGKTQKDRPLGYEAEIGERLSCVAFYAVDSGFVSEQDLLPSVLKLVDAVMAIK